MFSKRTITLAALLIAGATSAAVAYEDPENKIGDRFPFLEQQYPITRNTGARQVKMAQHVSLPQYANEDPENKIGDRFPLLEQQYATTRNAGVRQAKMPQNASLPQYVNEDPEDKIADRYPLLEQPIQFSNAASIGGLASSNRKTKRTAY